MLQIGYGKYSSYCVKGEFATEIHACWIKHTYMFVVIFLEIGFVLICATICSINNSKAASGEF